MGGTKNYVESGGFDKQTYEQVGITSNGIKIITKIDNISSNLPMHSNTPYTMYASKDSKTGALKQISVYGGKDGRQKIKDLDWAHPHREFKTGDIHVHIYDGHNRPSDNYRKPSKKEKRIVKIAMYGR